MNSTLQTDCSPKCHITHFFALHLLALRDPMQLKAPQCYTNLRYLIQVQGLRFKMMLYFCSSFKVKTDQGKPKQEKYLVFPSTNQPNSPTTSHLITTQVSAPSSTQSLVLVWRSDPD